MATIEWLQHCSGKRIVLENEFEPSNKYHKGCEFTVIMFDGIAYDYMDDSKAKYEYDYDLEGDLRKVQITTKENEKEVTKTLKVNYKDKKVSIPDVSGY